MVQVLPHLYDLYRSQRIVARNNDAATVIQLKNCCRVALPANDRVGEVVALNGSNIATLENLTIPGLSGYRFPNPYPNPTTPFTPYAGARLAEDKLLSNVVSLEIKFTGTANPFWAMAPVDGGLGLVWPRPHPDNPDYPYDVLPLRRSIRHVQHATRWFQWTGTQPQLDPLRTNLAGPVTDTRFGGDSGTIKPIRITGCKFACVFTT